MFARWGKKIEDDPEYSPFGPEILDCEITTSCNGINGKLCDYCYKSNTPKGKNMDFETFKSIVEKINVNKQLTQVAFGLGSTAEENPDLWKMCDYLRENRIIPNGTVAQLSDETAQKIALKFGAVAVSYHSDFEVLADTIKKLHEASKDPAATLKQINVHFMIAEETFMECFNLFQKVKSDKRFIGLNAIVLLGLKKCGRAIGNNYSKLSDDKFKNLIKLAFQNEIGIGFDSCSAKKFEKAINEIAEENIQKNLEKEALILKWKANLMQLSEPCESFGLFSSYINVDGDYFSCSFCENMEKPMSVLKCNNFIQDIWNGDIVKIRRDQSIKRKRECPYYDI
jgi:hypothetical protein